MGRRVNRQITAVDALGRDAELHIRGRVEWDDHGIHITDSEGRRWNIQYDDPVTLTPALEATS